MVVRSFAARGSLVLRGGVIRKSNRNEKMTDQAIPIDDRIAKTVFNALLFPKIFKFPLLNTFRVGKKRSKRAKISPSGKK